MSEPKLLEVFRSVGVQISDGALSNLLIKGQEPFHAEKAALVEAGWRSSPWQHTDDTATRVNGQNQYCHILCNPFYTAYTTLPNKDRLSVLDVLRNGRPRTFLLNDEALESLARVNVSALTLQKGRVITYCGGGIAASSAAFILTLLGATNVAVYDGSLTEWAADPTLPLVTVEA